MLVYTLEKTIGWTPCFKKERQLKFLFSPIWVNKALCNHKPRPDLPSTARMKFEYHVPAPDVLKQSVGLLWNCLLPIRKNSHQYIHVSSNSVKFGVFQFMFLDIFGFIYTNLWGPFCFLLLNPFHQILAPIPIFFPCHVCKSEPGIHKSKDQQICIRIGSQHCFCYINIWVPDIRPVRKDLWHIFSGG